MRNPIENLGGYNAVRLALQAVGGNMDALYKSIGDTAVSKATPKLLTKGGFIGAGILASSIGLMYFGNKGIKYLKVRKQKIDNEPALKKEFIETIEAELSIMNDDERAEEVL